VVVNLNRIVASAAGERFHNALTARVSAFTDDAESKMETSGASRLINRKRSTGLRKQPAPPTGSPSMGGLVQVRLYMSELAKG
jgi:hypothetical protein